MQIDDLTPYVLPDVLGCPLPLVTRAIVDAASEFCRMSRAAWLRQTHNVAATAVVAGMTTLAYTVPAGLAIYAPVAVEIDGCPKTLISDTCPLNTGSDSIFYSIASPNVTLSGLAAQDQTIKATFAVVPAKVSPTIPDSCSPWLEAIASGAKWRLMTMPQTQWFSGEAATYNEGLFRSGINRARIAANKGFSDVSLRVSPV